MFQDYLTRWNLTPDGEPIIRVTSQILPVRYQGRPAMLKIATDLEEKFGAGLMAWWSGDGAAHVFAESGDALLLERALGSRSLVEMARTDSGDDAACRIICAVVARLHAPRASAPEAVPLTVWFQELAPAAARHGGIFSRCAAAAEELFAHPQEETVLHGDIHHENILDFGKRGWLAIDPKRLRGERGFEYATLFCNPDHETAKAPGTVARRADVVSAAAGLDRRRLLLWVLAWAGLSAAWAGTGTETALQVAFQAAAALGL